MKKEWKILSKLSLNGSKEGKVSRVEDKDSISKGLATREVKEENISHRCHQ